MSESAGRLSSPVTFGKAACARKTARVVIGNQAEGTAIEIGGGLPPLVQSMTDTDTADIAATTAQIMELAEAGSALVRITVDRDEAARAVPKIRERLLDAGCTVPLAGDFHYNGHSLLAAHPACARMLDKYRINPGNVGFGRRKDRQFAAIVETALKYDKPVRIGANWGSLDRDLLARLMDDNAASARPGTAEEVTCEALIVSALNSARRAEEIGLAHNRIILSAKVSQVQPLLASCRALAARCDYPLHLGLTEAGMGIEGLVASAAAVGILLAEGIGDTIRFSLTPRPGERRSAEVIAAQALLQSLGLAMYRPSITACPGCGRTSSDSFRHLAQDVSVMVEREMPGWRARYPGVEALKIAVMGCIVNGPGESKFADIGISLPGNGEEPAAPVFIDGTRSAILRGPDIAGQFKAMLAQYIEKRYGTDTRQPV